jgi:hypothetical protein
MEIGDALRVEAIADEPGNCAATLFKSLAAQACKATMRAKLINACVVLCGFRGEITGSSLHLCISSTDLPVEQCPEPWLRPLLLAGHLCHEHPAFCKNFNASDLVQKKWAKSAGLKPKPCRAFERALKSKRKFPLGRMESG